MAGLELKIFLPQQEVLRLQLSITMPGSKPAFCVSELVE
jgi:hypothetical protein